MATGKFIAYYRVSTDKQKRSGLGLDAQKQAVQAFLDGGKWRLVGEYTERESGKRNDRPELAKALSMCRVHGAALVVAKLDRLSRDAEFLRGIVRESGERGVVFCDLPKVPEGPVGKFIIGIMAEVAELEAGLISQRTRAALAAAKRNGKVLGRPNSNIASYAKSGAAAANLAKQQTAQKRIADLKPVIDDIRATGATSRRAIAAALNERGISAPWGGKWSGAQVHRILT